MATTKIKFNFSQKGMSRADARRKTVEKFMEEEPGPAKDETYNRYLYHVETSPEGKILLVRPANLKLGFDFRIDVEGFKFRKGTEAPTHIDLFEDLKKKKGKNSDFFEQVLHAIIDVNDMKEPEELLKKIEDKNIGYSVEMLLKVSKWLAIEQDIRYWNGWGRNKQVVWLKLMNFFNFRYVPIDSGFKFYDEHRNLLSEKKSIELMDSHK